MNNKIPVLMFHGLESATRSLQQDDVDAFYTIPEKTFSTCLDIITDRGYVTLASDDIYANKYTNKNTIIITFDDGWQSDYEIAYPLLIKNNMKAIFFVVADWIGKKGYVSKTQLLEMSENGMDIQSHGATHRFLSQLPESEIHDELLRSKDKIESMLGKEVSSLSYPGGRGDKKVRDTGKKIGYKLFFSSKPGWYQRKENEVSRFVVHSKTSSLKLTNYININPITNYQLLTKYYIGRSLVKVVGQVNYNRIKNVLNR